MTNQQTVINDAALRKKSVLPIPPIFEDYSGYNEVRRKKLKSLPLSQTVLKSHGEALYSLLMKPFCRTTPAWVEMTNHIKQLADCLLAYADHLNVQKDVAVRNQNLDHPVRTIAEHASLEHRHKCVFDIKKMYRKLNDAVKAAGMGIPVIFNEDVHIDFPFASNTERYRFVTGLQLSIPIDIVKFCPGGSVLTTYAVVHVPEARSEPTILIQGARLLQQCQTQLKEFHTRAQRRMFKERLYNVAHVLPSVADLIYAELCVDGASSSHPETQQRLRLIFLGEKGLLADLRHLNAGRPSNKFDVFFEQLAIVVEQVTAADDRRHNVSHLSEWISVRELIQRAVERCPPETPLPSPSLVRLHFAPRNPYTHTALTFTSKLNVQFKIQRRQLRISHPDDHYCAAQLRYLKEKACEMLNHVVFLCCDDKAKVPVGDPGSAVSTGVRGKKTLAPTTTTLVSLDHDMTKSSLTPSVILQCNIPDHADKSFVQGKVVTLVNDSVLQTSSPFRHGAAIAKILKDSEAPVLMKFTDGGTDQRNTLESVKCAAICLFIELNLDMIIIARCAPGHSWTNPAERIMSILNLGLQNCALERPRSDEATEVEFKRHRSMAELRALMDKKPELRAKWNEVIQPVQSTIRHRFERLRLKDEAFHTMDPISGAEIQEFKRHLVALFPDMDASKLQKVHTQKIRRYTEWLDKHARCRQYSFQVLIFNIFKFIWSI